VFFLFRFTGTRPGPPRTNGCTTGWPGGAANDVIASFIALANPRVSVLAGRLRRRGIADFAIPEAARDAKRPTIFVACVLAALLVIARVAKRISG